MPDISKYSFSNKSKGANSGSIRISSFLLENTVTLTTSFRGGLTTSYDSLDLL
ncbi:hypothetical protein J2Y45_001513 [Dyadobacter sp. BE34]|uniref:Uncharacterized protein n=1 Tax=Dyadobacter fermentans TaxID=94254 RepID=A0ABU1QSW0_9BACT|nr:hypothetical protein [Dyadobacter fermentans]MDR7041984.1 hypothetical protein [Dyadobacter sp. BE242]MDR7196387.1 hypothetical protein [Dyadobacter sp. BE34]MDR7213068.1 hypothetical protein [Dyadobacter sp. BE31]MDR7261793.1 hypothetical protein [Dyadobacter sp. BE32]